MTPDRSEPQPVREAPLTLFLGGDVMTGRGIDQVLPTPSDPGLFEPYVTDAREYVALAERTNGPIPAPVPFDYVWGDALGELDRAAPDARIVNLETSVTTSEDRALKHINYRMHPLNVPCLTAAGLDCCVLANNHVLDWGRDGLDETLRALRDAGLQTAGAGYDAEKAARPAVLPTPRGRILVFAYGMQSSGVPPRWAATEDGLGVSFLADLSRDTAAEVAAYVQSFRTAGDVVVLSIHWGGNWGYAVPREQRHFAHRLVDAGAADVIHGHSSHHPRGLELYGGRLILYGCGDLLNDYEGISGYEEYRDDLTLMYFATLDAAGRARVRMVPMQLRGFRLWRAEAQDVRWLAQTLDRECARLGTRIELTDDGSLQARPDS